MPQAKYGNPVCDVECRTEALSDEVVKPQPSASHIMTDVAIREFAEREKDAAATAQRLASSRASSDVVGRVHGHGQTHRGDGKNEKKNHTTTKY
jgi:hypothetical protein